MIGSKIRVLSKPLCVLGAAALILFMGASNGLAVSNAGTSTIVEFDFNDVAGVAMMDNPANGATPVVSDNVSGFTWSPRDPGDEIDLENMQTDGLGSLSADLYTVKSRKDGSIFLPFPNHVRADFPFLNPVAVMTVVFDPWDFGPLDIKGTDPATGTPNSFDKEETRFGFGNTSATNTLLFVKLQRETAFDGGTDSVTLFGDTAGGNGAQDGVETDIAGWTTTEPLTVELTVNKATNLWSIRYGFGDPNTVVLADLPGNTNLMLDSARIGAFIRLAFEGDYSDDSFGVASYVVTQTHIPEPATCVLLSFAFVAVAMRRRRR